MPEANRAETLCSRAEKAGSDRHHRRMIATIRRSGGRSAMAAELKTQPLSAGAELIEMEDGSVGSIERVARRGRPNRAQALRSDDLTIARGILRRESSASHDAGACQNRFDDGHCHYMLPTNRQCWQCAETERRKTSEVNNVLEENKDAR